MSANTKIEWCDHTFNPWIGCTKVSPGCVNCYAEGESKRRGWAQWGKGKERHRTSENYWKQPIKWNRDAAICKCGECKASQLHDCEFGRYDVSYFKKMKRARVFCASLADWLDDEVPIEWLADLLALIKATSNLDWLLLTKRPELCHQRILEAGIFMVGYRDGQTSNEPTAQHYPNEETAEWVNAWALGGEAPNNVWIGVSAEDQERWDARVEILGTIPAAVRFVSAEPLLGQINAGRGLNAFLNDSTYPAVDWVIIGGESGPKARMCNIEWIRSLVDQCQFYDVPVFVKQLGAHPVIDRRIRLLGDRKGGDPTEWPEDLRVREFPTTNKERAGEHNASSIS